MGSTHNPDLLSAVSVLSHAARQPIPTLAHICTRCAQRVAAVTTPSDERICWRCYEAARGGDTEQDEAEREDAEIADASALEQWIASYFGVPA